MEVASMDEAILDDQLEGTSDDIFMSPVDPDGGDDDGFPDSHTTITVPSEQDWEAVVSQCMVRAAKAIREDLVKKLPFQKKPKKDTKVKLSAFTSSAADPPREATSYTIQSAQDVAEEMEDGLDYLRFDDGFENYYDLTGEYVDEPGAEVVTMKELNAMTHEEQAKFVKGMHDEVDKLNEHDTKEDVTQKDIFEKWVSKGIRVKRIPGKAVLTRKPLHDGQRGMDARCRACCCGNFEPGTNPGDEMNRAEVPATYELRTMLAMAAEKGWRIGALDIRSAFLHASLDEEDGIIVVEPPKIFVRHGVVKDGVMWKLNKVLYGLRSGPRKWGEYRDHELQKMMVYLPGENDCKCAARGTIHQCESTPNLWYVRKEDNDEVVACFMVYVDDVLVVGHGSWVLATLKAFEKKWKCKVAGVLKEYHEEEGEVFTTFGKTKTAKKLAFLGMTLEITTPDNTIQIHQRDFILAKLDARGMLTGWCAKGNLPQVQEGLPLEDKNSPEYDGNFQKAQIEIGTLQWLAIKTRPDIAAITSILASMMTRTPTTVLKHVAGIWKYLASSWDAALQYPRGGAQIGDSRLAQSVDGTLNEDSRRRAGGDYNKEKYKVLTITDASFAPGGDRSRTGVCIFAMGRLVHWVSTKQTVTAMSSCEAELDAAIAGIKHAQGIAEVVQEMCPQVCIIQELNTDSASAIQAIKNTSTSWRNRHFSLRASWMRDFLAKGQISVEYKPGKDLEADLLTKVLERVKLETLRRKLGVLRPSEGMVACC